ncbi:MULTISPECIES: methionine ABC transporter ATP-binding protein [unclassified Brenneria]|uniref:methionine ABC transporter ATP-binding protein n=1 Tax=unclassified Brenneria TaxID=2634434 RepID=UPI0029C2F93A|nr:MULTISPECIES: methionine ABC transporter ATP-binding protein [unclassified Brenneria]MDX5628546.1 methionine ABC transporter ATP-binding protein [Brenneria sp. L3-3Z]MDX5695685.1 methionine ABC transporter ATP-binding protein [Brenneria sp. L4-2C]
MIDISQLHKQYRGRNGESVEVLKGVSLQVPAGSITAVVGPSGAGKSTLAKCISLLERPSSGSIQVNGQDLSRLSGEALRRERRAIGTVFQSSALLQRKTAWQNVALPLEYLGVIPAEIEQRVGHLLESVGLSDKAASYPAQLSGGQRQRVGIARALALNPSVLLADEATSGLDPASTRAILTLLKRLRDEFGLSIILITHEMEAVRNAADAVAELRDGAIVQQGAVRDLLAAPDSLLGRQLFPLEAVDAQGDLLLHVTYSARQPVAADWISHISQLRQLRIDLLGGHIERVGGQLAGRLQLAVHFQGAPLAPGALVEQLSHYGVIAQVAGESEAWREAV